MTLKGAWKAMETATKAVPEENASLLSALGRVSAAHISVPLSVPAFAVSALDGYSVKGRGREFRLKDFIEPFSPDPVSLNRGEAAFVATGAPIPPGTRFVRREKTTEGEGLIIVPAEGDDRKVWPRGCWIKRGTGIVRRGEAIRPSTVESLALVKREEIRIFRKPSVTILTTGDELKKGRIPDSNRYLLASLSQRDGAEIAGFETAGDTDAEIREKIEALHHSDLLLITGGTSKGRKDFTYRALEDLKGMFLVRRPPFRPGQTMAFGKMDRLLFFILPGNPKALVTLYELFVRSCLFKLSGRRKWRPTISRFILKDGVEKRGENVLFVPVRLSLRESSIEELYSNEPDGIAIIDRGAKRVEAGQTVEVVWHERKYL